MNKITFAILVLAAGLILLMMARSGSFVQNADGSAFVPSSYQTLSLADDDLSRFELSESEWKSKLSREQYYVTRKHGTERPFSNAYDKNKREGLYRCICCGLPLFESKTKYNSRTGWPSFWAPIAEDHIATPIDGSGLLSRTEVHCARCEGHLGHVFNDGPRPTGLRYCMNSASLHFIDADPPEEKAPTSSAEQESSDQSEEVNDANGSGLSDGQ